MKEISKQYFNQCPQLEIIEDTFPLIDIDKQLQRRDTQCQFELIRALTETKKHKLRLRMNTIHQNKKNRYPQQSIYQDTRVILRKNPQTTYINANYLKHCIDKNIIITQGPLQSTLLEFFQMIQQENVECIVTLCEWIENGKNRCFDYLEQLEVHEIEMSQDDKNIIHIFYRGWPDRGIPTKMSGVKKVLQEMLKYSNILIHCSAGLGRSGVIAALGCILCNEGPISVFGQVRKLRQSRFQSVQNSEQYKFIYDYLVYHIHNL